MEMKKQNFKKLCELIVAKNGNISSQDVLDCGYTMEHFIRMAQPNVNTEKLVKNASKMLADGGK